MDVHSMRTRYRKASAAALLGIPAHYRDAKNAPVNFRTKMQEIHALPLLFAVKTEYQCDTKYSGFFFNILIIGLYFKIPLALIANEKFRKL